MQNNIDLSAIVAMTPERVIGKNGTVPWYARSDLRRFKKLTEETGIVIMGRETYDSILARNKRPLPDRLNIVMSRRRQSRTNKDGVVFVSSIEDALGCIRNHAEKTGRTPAASIIGGAEIYRLFLPLVNTIHITVVRAMVDNGDAFFPELPEDEWGTWQTLNHCDYQCVPGDSFDTAYCTLTRRVRLCACA